MRGYSETWFRHLPGPQSYYLSTPSMLRNVEISPEDSAATALVVAGALADDRDALFEVFEALGYLPTKARS